MENTVIATEDLNSQLVVLKQKLDQSFSEIRNELDEHLEVVNEHTSEVETQFEYLAELDNKIEKLAEKIDDINMFLGINKEYFEITRKLGKREISVFLAVYEGEEVSYRDIAKKLALPESVVRKTIENMIGKGVPIEKRIRKEGLFLTLDKYFKRMQMKYNVLKIDNSPKKSVQISLLEAVRF